MTHRTVFRDLADRNVQWKISIPRIYIYIYTVLCDSTPEQHEIENYEKKG